MAKGAVIYDAMWRQRPFRALSRPAQCLYVQLCSEKDLDCAGLLTLNVAVLAKACDELDESAIREDLAELERDRFVFVDYDTDELFIRARMRTLGVVKSPNVLTSALTSARGVQSRKLAVEVAGELRRLGHVKADEVAEIVFAGETLSEPFRYPPTSSPSLNPQHLTPRARPICSRHPENHDGPCRTCQRRREWDDAHADTAQLDVRRAIRDGRAGCSSCDDNGMIETVNGMVRCTSHSEAL